MMDGTDEEAQIVFNGLYNTINAISEVGWLAQGRDISQHLKTIVSSIVCGLCEDYCLNLLQQSI